MASFHTVNFWYPRFRFFLITPFTLDEKHLLKIVDKVREQVFGRNEVQLS
jgi:hypothetical protein